MLQDGESLPIPSRPRRAPAGRCGTSAEGGLRDRRGADPVVVMRLIRAYTDLPIATVKEIVRSAPSSVATGWGGARRRRGITNLARGPDRRC